MVFSIQKEANFMKAIELYTQKNGYDLLLGIDKPKTSKSIVPRTVDLPKITDADVEEYQSNVNKSIRKHKKLYEAFKDKIPHVDALIYRYDVYNILSNISLSVNPTTKKKWKITHELFGAFYNVDLTKPYNSLFHDLEPNSMGNVHFFKPEKGQIILANPPYTVDWIRWTIRSILDKWKGIATFYVVIPVWDIATRTELGLKKYPDFPEITELLEQATEHNVYLLTFYDGINQKNVHLKDPVHVIKI